MQEQEPSLTASDQPVEQRDSSADTMPMSELLKQAEQQAQEYHDAWLRAKAEADNIRKRAQADVANAHKYGLESFSSALLPVRDSLEAALTTENSTLDALRQGVELTLKQVDSAFDKFAIREINPVGGKFDPHQHQAMTTVESDKPPNTVIHVLQKGYALNDRILRPALVTVSRAKNQ